MKTYLKVLAACYFVGFALHVLDLLELRLPFWGMPTGWKLWIVYLLIADLGAAVGLWMQQPWGVGLFLLVAISQLVAYLGYHSYFGDQEFLIAFHIITLLIFVVLLILQMRKQKNQKQ